MTAASTLLAELSTHGLRVRAVAGNLHISPLSALTPDLRSRVLAAKPELPRLLDPEPLNHGLACREVWGYPAALLPELPIPTSLVLAVPQLSLPVTIATYASCPRRSFTADEWLAGIALVNAGFASPMAFRTWCLGHAREQLAAVAPPAAGCNTTVARVLAAFGCKLRAVVLEGAAP